MAKYQQNLASVRANFDRDALAATCIRPEADFGEAYNLRRIDLDFTRPSDEDFYFFGDRGSRVLAVAHLDTVVYPDARTARFVETDDGEVVFSGALDDRLGAYIILHLLPALGIEYDILLTVGEESGQSTAEYFMPPGDKVYDWIIEFDRGGTDVVMYQYEDADTIRAVRATGAHVASGIFSDISYMEHLETKAFNWGVGYRDYHGPRSHAFLEDTFEMVARYLKFHQLHEGTPMPHDHSGDSWHLSLRSRRSYGSFDDYYLADRGEKFERVGDVLYGCIDGEWREVDDTFMGTTAHLSSDPWGTPEDDGYVEPIYFDEDFVVDPSQDDILAALEAMDEAEARNQEV